MFGPSPGDLMVGAMNHADYSASATCGACASVVGPSGTIKIRIVDQCPGCMPGDIDLSPMAFDGIAARALGRVAISWQYIPCSVMGPVSYRFKEGSNPWWTAVQVRHHRYAVATFAYRKADGSYQQVVRTDYNYFVADSGMGPGPYTFRVTDVFGHTIEDSNVPLQEGAEVAGSHQFPECVGK
jgi:expansin (peptidoglycan-binding protein)